MDQIAKYSQVISKENFFHLVLLMFQVSDTFREKTITIICKMMKTGQSQMWFELLRREFYYAPIGRGTAKKIEFSFKANVHSRYSNGANYGE